MASSRVGRWVVLKKGEENVKKKEEEIVSVNIKHQFVISIVNSLI